MLHSQLPLTAVYLNVLGEHEGVGAPAELDIAHPQAVHAPEGLVGVGNEHPFKAEVLHLPEKLRAVDHAVAHHHVVAIPDGGTRFRGETAVLNEAAVHVPEGILAEEAATRYLEVAAVLQGRLSVDQVMFSMRAP